MPAGTITLTNNSATVTGSGTSFTSELKPNDFIVAVVGGVTYTLGVQSVNSATSVTLITAYGGPTTSALAWTPVPNAALVGITAQVAADVAKAIRGLNLDKANWQQVFSGTGSITVNLPDGSSYTGPAWGSITETLNNKANSTDVLTKADNLNSVADKAAARTNLGLGDLATLNGPLAINKGGTGSATPFGSAANTFAQGNDSRLNTINGKTGGALAAGSFIDILSSTFGSPASGSFLSGSIVRTILNGRGGRGDSRGAYFGLNVGEQVGTSGYGLLQFDGFGDNRFWNFYQNGNAAAGGSWINSSDERHKSNIKLVPDALRAVLTWRGCTYDKLDGVSEVGLIAQDVEKDCPTAVSNVGRREFSNGKVIEDFKALNTSGAAAAYHTEAIKALFNLVELALISPDKALACIDSIKAAINQTSGS